MIPGEQQQDIREATNVSHISRNIKSKAQTRKLRDIQLVKQISTALRFISILQ